MNGTLGSNSFNLIAIKWGIANFPLMEQNKLNHGQGRR